jgi:hypothetical protein
MFPASSTSDHHTSLVVFFFFFMTFICFEGLRFVLRKEKITSSTRDSYCIFGGRSGVANFIAKNVLTY